MTIWAIFSIANEYDQPNNNLENLYKNRPTFEQLSRFFFEDMELDEENMIDLDLILEGNEIGVHGKYGIKYRLEEVEVTD